MKIYDRYINKNVSENELPNQIDFGRYCFFETGQDITCSNLITNKVIRQELLLEKNKSIQDILIDISIDIEKSTNGEFNVVPLIRRIRNKLGLNEFEKLLFEKVFHLEEVFRVPHYLLEREIEKVNVSRAKKIPSKSYQYLASHTEDWIHKSIVNFKPSRILNEELDLNFDIYENQLAAVFVERCLVYFNSRLKEIQDIKSFLSDYDKLLKNRDDQKGWYKKIFRNLSLIGSVYEDGNHQNKNAGGSTLTETEEVLNQVHKRLLQLRKSNLFEIVNKKVMHSISLRNTNVLVNHKHYRYLKSLWIELDQVKPEKSVNQKLKFEQDVINGLRNYAKSLITYSLTENLEYELIGNFENYSAIHLFLSDITFEETGRGILELKVGNHKIKIIVVGNIPAYDEKLFSLLENSKTFIFYYNEEPSIKNSNLINVNLLDPDSLERVGILLRKFLLQSYLENLQKCYHFKQGLKEYVKYFPDQFLSFNVTDYTYYFHSYPNEEILLDQFKNNIENDPIFKAKSRPQKEDILKTISELVVQINEIALELKNKYLHCFNCGEKINSYNVDRLNYIKCISCTCLIDSSNLAQVTLKIDDPKNFGISAEEFGIDSITLSMEET